MRHGLKEETLDWYWTDGNDVADSGVWTHALDNSEVSFYPPRVMCRCTDTQPNCSGFGDAFILYIGDEKQLRGNYCDFNSSSQQYFICEAAI